MAQTFEKARGRKVPFEIVGRRSGGTAEFFAVPKLAEQPLNWKAYRDLESMCVDSWRSQRNNSQGYQV